MSTKTSHPAFLPPVSKVFESDNTVDWLDEEIEFAHGLETAVHGLEVLERGARVGVETLIRAHIARLETIRDATRSA